MKLVFRILAFAIAGFCFIAGVYFLFGGDKNGTITWLHSLTLIVIALYFFNGNNTFYSTMRTRIKDKKNKQDS